MGDPISDAAVVGEAGKDTAAAGAASAGGVAESAGVVGATAASGAGAGYGAALETGAGLGGTLAGAATSVGKALTSPAGMLGLGEVGSAVATSILAPKPPSAASAAKPIPMPDPLAEEAATRQATIEQLARRGRASTILTSPSNTLGGG